MDSSGPPPALWRAIEFLLLAGVLPLKLEESIFAILGLGGPGEASKNHFRNGNGKTPARRSKSHTAWITEVP